MRVRFVVDRIVVEGMSLSRAEREALEGTLRASLSKVLGRVSEHKVMPASRRVPNERMALNLSIGTKGALLGDGLGTALGNRVLSGDPSPGSVK